MLKSESCRLRVRIQPGASQNAVLGYEAGILKLRIAAPPVEGKANRKTVEFIAGLLDVSPSCLVIKTGLTGRQKTLVINGLSATRLNDILKGLTG